MRSEPATREKFSAWGGLCAYACAHATGGVSQDSHGASCRPARARMIGSRAGEWAGDGAHPAAPSSSLRGRKCENDNSACSRRGVATCIKGRAAAMLRPRASPAIGHGPWERGAGSPPSPCARLRGGLACALELRLDPSPTPRLPPTPSFHQTNTALLGGEAGVAQRAASPAGRRARRAMAPPRSLRSSSHAAGLMRPPPAAAGHLPPPPPLLRRRAPPIPKIR